MSKKKITISIICVVVAVILLICIFKIYEPPKTISTNTSQIENLPSGIRKVMVDGKEIYEHYGKEWDGEYASYHFAWSTQSLKDENIKEITDKYSKDFMKVISYNDYLQFMDDLKYAELQENELQPYTDRNKNYLVLYLTSPNRYCNLTLCNIQNNQNKIVVYGSEDKLQHDSEEIGHITIIPTIFPFSFSFIIFPITKIYLTIIPLEKSFPILFSKF